MSRSLDGYVTRAVVGSVAASLLFFLFLTVLLDLLNGIGNYLNAADKQGVTTIGLLWYLASYYVRQSPFLFVSIAPFATVIGCMFAVARLMAQNELQPMLFVGRSMVRVLQPALWTGVVVGLGMVACYQWVVPTVADEVGSMQTFLSGGERALKNLVLEQRGGGFVGLHVAEYDPGHMRMRGVVLVRVGAQPGDAVGVLAEGASWDAAIGDWRLTAGVRRTSDGEQPCAILGAPEWTPEIVRARGQDDVPCELLSYDELVATRAQRPHRKDVAMALHRHVTYPLANVILLLLALPFAIHYERRSRIERVLGAIGACGAYLLFDLTFQNLGYNGHVHPIVAAWSPTILFGSLGIVLYGSMRT